ncbi:hypothetical protein S245_055709, partial [Arachis hypogaea]
MGGKDDSELWMVVGGAVQRGVGPPSTNNSQGQMVQQQVSSSVQTYKVSSLDSKKSLKSSFLSFIGAHEIFMPE